MNRVAFYKPLETSFLGFDRLFSDIERLLETNHSTHQVNGFPPFNLFKEKDGYTIEIALAGYRKEDIKISHDRKNNVLSISSEGSQEDYPQPDGRELVRIGIAKRSFIRNFTVADNVVVKSAEMQDGLLSIALEVVEREEDKPLLISVK